MQICWVCNALQARELVDSGRILVHDEVTGDASILEPDLVTVKYKVNVEARYCGCHDTSGLLCKHIRGVGRCGMRTYEI